MRPRKTPKAANALVPLSQTGTEIALQALAEDTKTYRINSRAESTQRNYRYWWRDFSDWCRAHGLSEFPAVPDGADRKATKQAHDVLLNTVAGYATYLAKGRGGTKAPLAIASIGQAMAAISLAQTTKGFTFDIKSPLLREPLKGIRREIAKTRTIQRVDPIMDEDLRDMLQMLRPDVLREARDAAMISLGWAAALRRSELVGLDWLAHGSGNGYLGTDDKGLTVTLMTSKASQDTAQSVAVPRAFVPVICKAVEDWAKLAKIERGTPLCRPIEGKLDGKTVGASRLTDRSVARAIKRRAYQLVMSRSKGRNRKTKEEIKAIVRKFSGHSMRVGHVTSAYESGMTPDQIKMITRHKGTAMVSEYIRPLEQMKHHTLQKIRGL